MIDCPSCKDLELLRAIERVRHGDSDAFEVIYHQCSARVQNLCRYRLRWHDRCLQYEEDLVSEIMTSIWKSLRDPTSNWESSDELWQAIHRLVFEGCINRFKYNNRQKRRNELELPLLFDALYGHRVGAIGVAEVDADDLIETLLTKLLDNELIEFVMLKLSGLNNDEIANQWGVSLRTVQRKMEAARQFFDTQVAIRVES